jgi:membrane-associated protease RseP (regulator of RpoE activity)
MRNKRWLWGIVPAMGLAGLFILGSSAMQAQVATQPKTVEKTRPVPAEERSAPAESSANTKAAEAKRALDDSERHGAATRERDSRGHQGGGWLGVYIAEPDESKAVSGVQISQIFPASPAARAGFRGGDIITQVNDEKVTDAQSFMTAIEAMAPGTKATFAVQRNDQPVKLTATLGQNHWTFRGQDEDFAGFDGMRGRGRMEEEYPIYALELEHNRRMAEQHQRMEQMLLELKEEVRQLREELKARK